MLTSRHWLRASLAASFVLLSAPALLADTVKQMNLAEMVQRSDKIYRATVISATPGTVEVGGSQLPIITYRLQVDEVFRGNVPTVKGVKIAEIRTLGKMKPVQHGNARLISALPKMPELSVGKTYLVMTTRPSAIGLSTTVGLGQGSFQIFGRGKSETAVNAVNNRGLFRDMAPPPSAGARQSLSAAASPQGGSIPYSELARQIRAQLGQ
jgi:hypothetical protein